MTRADARLDQTLQDLRDSLPTVTPSIDTERNIVYSKDLAVQIAAHYASGKSLFKIAEMPGMPSYGALQDWAKHREDFRAALSAMREIRALHYEDAAIDAVEEVTDPKDVPAARLRSETYWRAAEVNDPSRYGKKVTHAGDSSNPIQIVVNTGWTEPLNEFQRPPTLGTDGLIQRAKPVQAEVETPSPEVKDE